MQNYLYLIFPLANLKTLSGVLVAKILLENDLIQTLVLLLSFSDINPAMLSSLNEANLLQASYFVLVLFSRVFIKDTSVTWTPHIRHIYVISVQYFFGPKFGQK